MGVYEGASPLAAKEAYCKDAGYATIADAAEAAGQPVTDFLADIEAQEVMTLADFSHTATYDPDLRRNPYCGDDYEQYDTEVPGIFYKGGLNIMRCDDGEYLLILENQQYKNASVTELEPILYAFGAQGGHLNV